MNYYQIARSIWNASQRTPYTICAQANTPTLAHVYSIIWLVIGVCMHSHKHAMGRPGTRSQSVRCVVELV